MIDTLLLTSLVKQRAQALGFDRVGITSAAPSAYSNYFREWLAAGKQGSMAYLERRFEERVDPRVYFPAARSVICVAINYHQPLSAPIEAAYAGKIARYALGDDYHDLIKERLFELADWLKAQVPGTLTRCGVDTAPIAEKELSARAGVGWMGKNTCILHESIGSWLLLGEILTDVDLALDEPAIDHCGTCTRCIDACPTGAIDEPYQLDATRCISYQTIEAKTAQADLETAGWLYGCDICQDVCPYNRRAPVSNEIGFAPRFASGSLDVREVAMWDVETFKKTLARSAMKRVKLDVLQGHARRLLEQVEKIKQPPG